MYKCTECGHLFEDGEQARWTEMRGFTDGRGEEWSGCPMCKGGYEEAKLCKSCDEGHTESELFDGWCAECLKAEITYDSFFEYCEDVRKEQYPDEQSYLDLFVMETLLDVECPKHISYDFHQLMIDEYKRRVESAKAYPKTDDFLAECIRFILEDDGDIGKENFAEWMNKKGVK